MGLTGAADTTIILDRDSSGCTLYARGRDIEEYEKAVMRRLEGMDGSHCMLAYNHRRASIRKMSCWSCQRNPSAAEARSVFRCAHRCNPQIAAFAESLIRHHSFPAQAAAGAGSKDGWRMESKSLAVKCVMGFAPCRNAVMVVVFDDAGVSLGV